MQILFRGWIFVLCLSLSVSTLGAQQGGSDSKQPVPAHLKSLPDRQLKLDVVVTDKTNQPIAGLQQQDFTVLNNKHPAKILSFQSETGTSLTPDAATEIILVIDEVNTAFERVAFERDEVKRFLTQNGGKLAHPVTLVFFSDLGTQIQATPSRDGNQLAAALDEHANQLRMIPRNTGIYGAEERIQLSLKTLTLFADNEANKPGRKMVIWISPGWPLLSGPRFDLSFNQAQNILQYVVNVSAALRRARITLYSVDPLGLADVGGLRTTYYQEYLKGVNGPNQAEIADLSLQVLAAQSGGQVLYGNNSIVTGLDRCLADLDAFYTLSIETPPDEKPNEYHAIEVKIGPKGLIGRTRTGYYGQP